VHEDLITLALLSPLDLEQHTYLSESDPPPSYTDAIADAPPTYKPIANLDRQHNEHDVVPGWQRKDLKLHLNPITPSMIDFGDSSNFHQVGAKKKKQQAKQADKAKWADSGDEGNKDEGGGEENGGGGGGGGSDNGDGGAGDDGGGGDDWNTGNKKKKGKKGKAAEEEEEKKKEEEEQRKKDEADAVGGDDPLSWANGGDANPADEWSGFSTTAKKGKKGKKEKVNRNNLSVESLAD